MQNNSFKIILISSLLAFIVSCEKVTDKPDINANNLKGIFVVCEGNFGAADGDLTYYSHEEKAAIRFLYNSVNGAEIGDVVQSFAIADTLGFIVVNNSQKVTVVNMKDFTVIKTLIGFSYPRSIVWAGKKEMFLANGNGFTDNYICSIDLETLEVSGKIELAAGPESLITSGPKVYATLSGGFANDGNSVIEIDPGTLTITGTFTVGPCPVDIAADKDKNLWVYCKGTPDYSNYPDVAYSGMGISKVNVQSGGVTTMNFTSMNAPGINNISASPDGNTIYFLNDGLYSMPSTSTGLPSGKLVDQSFYGIDVDPQNGSLVCLDVINSKAIVYDADGLEQFSFDTGSFPNSAVFSY